MSRRGRGDKNGSVDREGTVEGWPWYAHWGHRSRERVWKSWE